MVFSPELGYDPEEWEECPEPEHFLAFGFFTRLWLTLVAIGFAGGFFWLLEARKEWGKLAKDEQSSVDKDESQPERRMSLEARLAAEQMRNEAVIIGVSAQRDARSSRSIERKLQLEPLEALQTLPPPPSSHLHTVPPGAFDNIQDLRALNLTSLQNAPPCVTPSEVSIDRVSLDKQYSVIAKNLEKQLLAEIKHFGLLINREGDVEATKQVTEALQERHKPSIHEAVNDLVQREAGGSSEIAQIYRKELEKKIENAVWQFNHNAEHDNADIKANLYETALGQPDSEEIWKRQNISIGLQKTDLNRVSGEFTQQQVKSFFEPASSDPQTPTKLQQKGSSSSEEGFIKVYPHQATSEQLIPRSPSTAAGSCITADDIEFMPSRTEGVVQGESVEKPKPLKPQEIDEIKRLLQEYDLNSLRDEIPNPVLAQTHQTAIPKEHHKPPPLETFQQSPQEVYKPEPVKVVQAPSGDYYPYGKSSVSQKRPPELDVHLQAPIQQQSPQGEHCDPNPDLFLTMNNITVTVSSPVSPRALGFEIVDSPMKGQTASAAPKTGPNAEDNVTQFFYTGGQPHGEYITSKNITLPASAPTAPDNDPRRLAEADIYLQDAIEYVEASVPPKKQEAVHAFRVQGSGSGDGFIIEEDMLESSGRHGPKGLPPPNLSDLEKQLRPSSGISQDRTSRFVKTNEVFSKPEPSFDDADDAITSAPEIQSIEIPPDQMSESSNYNIDNLSEHHDFMPGSSVEAVPPKSINKQGAQPQFLETNIKTHKNRRGAPEAPKMWRVSPTPDDQSISVSISERGGHPWKMRKQSSLLSVLNVTSMQEMLLTLTSLDGLAAALRKAGLESTNLIFGIDYTASNKYQGELSFKGLSLHHVDSARMIENPYQQVIRIMGNSLAPFATSGVVPVYGFGDATTGDWSVFKLKAEGQCRDLDEVLNVYTQVTPTINLSGPTNFAPLIYEAIRICQRAMDYHILVIIADGQVTNERATRKAIVHACHYPLSIIVVGVGDGPWDMMRVFDESLPKRPWDNFHFVEFHEIMKAANETSGDARELAFAVQSLLEVPDQFATVRRLGLLRPQSVAE